MTTQTTARLGPNDLVPCPSKSSRFRHLAKAERCDICQTEGKAPR